VTEISARNHVIDGSRETRFAADRRAMGSQPRGSFVDVQVERWCVRTGGEPEVEGE